MVQLLTSCPDIFRLPSSKKSSYGRLSRRSKYTYSYKKLSRSSDFDFGTELQCPKPVSMVDSSFALLATLQISVRAEFSCMTNSNSSSSNKSTEKILSSFENNTPNLRKQGRLALTFALRKYSDVSSEERIALANEIEREIDGLYVGSEYRENIYFVGGLLAEEGSGEEIVMKLVTRETTIGDLLVWGGKSGEWEKQLLA